MNILIHYQHFIVDSSSIQVPLEDLLGKAQIAWKAAGDKMNAAQKALDDWNAAVAMEVETANATTATTTQHSHSGNRPDYLGGKGTITSNQVS